MFLDCLMIIDRVFCICGLVIVKVWFLDLVEEYNGCEEVFYLFILVDNGWLVEI